jgi:hypothetical protein
VYGPDTERDEWCGRDIPHVHPPEYAHSLERHGRSDLSSGTRMMAAADTTNPVNKDRLSRYTEER